MLSLIITLAGGALLLSSETAKADPIGCTLCVDSWGGCPTDQILGDIICGSCGEFNGCLWSPHCNAQNPGGGEAIRCGTGQLEE